MINPITGGNTPQISNYEQPAPIAQVSPELVGKNKETGLPVVNTVEKSEKGSKGRGVNRDYGDIDCKTCSERRYQDGSDDPGVSMKSPTKLSPSQAGSAVRAHEQEHVTRETAKANNEGREIVSQTVDIHMGICPECGRSYVAGGTTTTTTKKASENNQKGVSMPSFDFKV